jgi:hypothetical protein
VVSLNGATSVLGASACTIQAYFHTWTRANAWHNCADGGGVGFRINSKYLLKANASALIVWSSYNVS